MTQRTLLISVILVAVLGGCMGLFPGDDTTSSMNVATTTTLSTTNTTNTTSTANTINSGCGRASVSYWGLNGSVEMQAWTQNTLRLKYVLPANVSVFFVAYENNTILGIEHVNTTSSVAADGEPFTLNTQLSGTHTVNVKLYEDTNGNGDFDPDVDTVCRHNGAIVQTGTKTLNFSAFDSE